MTKCSGYVKCLALRFDSQSFPYVYNASCQFHMLSLRGLLFQHYRTFIESVLLICIVHWYDAFIWFRFIFKPQFIDIIDVMNNFYFPVFVALKTIFFPLSFRLTELLAF